MSDACLRILFLLTTTASLLPATTIVFSGVVLQANPNSLGITTSSTVSGSIDYSIALIGSGSESISPSGTFTTFADPTLSVDIRIESFTATTTEEVGYPDGPEIGFVDGQLDYLLFWKDAFDCSTGTCSGDCYFHAFDVINIVPPVGNFEFVFYEDSGGGPVEFARGEFSSFQVIPEPGSFALMGAGLAALVIGWRRKRAACGRRGAPS